MVRKAKLNKLIDDIFHDYFDNPGAVIIDATLHAIVERDSLESTIKFLRYDLEPLLKSIRKRA